MSSDSIYVRLVPPMTPPAIAPTTGLDDPKTDNEPGVVVLEQLLFFGESGMFGTDIRLPQGTCWTPSVETHNHKHFTS